MGTVPAKTQITGLPSPAAKAFFCLTRYLASGQGFLLLAKDEEELAAVQESLSSIRTLLYPDLQAAFIHIGEDSFSKSDALNALLSLRAGTPAAVTATFSTYLSEAPGRDGYGATAFSLKPGDTISRRELLDRLEKAGYERTDFTEQPGQYAVRGSVVDIFCVSPQDPARLFFTADTLESIRIFDTDTQQTVRQAQELPVLPASMRGTSTIQEWCPPGMELLIYAGQTGEDFGGFTPEKNTFTLLSSLPGEGEWEDFGVNANMAFNGSLELAAKELNRLKDEGFSITVSCLNGPEAERLQELIPETASSEFCTVAISALESGFYHRQTKTAVITASEIFNRGYSSSKLLKKFKIAESKKIRLNELKPGDFVVHEDYGIGRYLGLKSFCAIKEVFDAPPENAVDCLELEYKNGHKIFVPMYDFGKVQKYVGGNAKAPRVSSLSTETWSEVKHRVKQQVEQVAAELLRQEALRAAAQAVPFSGDTHMEREFSGSFPYEETPDQTKAIESILHDMALEKPMERVLVGDVGFGKTEVAMRAAMRCALGGKQAVVLVPTTILAAQHYRTFKARMAGFPVNIAMLCRFQSDREQKEIISGAKNGAHDILIGTHRLLSKDIGFKSLGLCIIDEEHRFGVKQKEKIKALCRGVHTLMLSATPIPRTLNQALSNLKDISYIESPPEGRMPISTRVVPWDENLAAAAIREELARKGQIYYVHNRVQTLVGRKNFLQKLVPEARICVAHGQMDEKILEQALWDFFNKKYDILLSSTIIESGLDMPDVNTLIVEHSHMFGLAQLYQLRGRIGRGNKKAYCYLFFPPGLGSPEAALNGEPETSKKPSRQDEKTAKTMTEDAAKRLTALKEFGQLGSGFRLAMRDMEIRGAGELLGTRQHGFINEIGLWLYCELLASEVKRLKGSADGEENVPAALDIKINAYIPQDYVPDEMERLNYYKKLLAADEKSADRIRREMEDICGRAPDEVKNLVRLMALRAEAGKAGIRQMTQTSSGFDIIFRKGFRMPSSGVNALIKTYEGSIRFITSTLGDGVKITCESRSPVDTVAGLVSSLRTLLAKC